MGEAEDLDLETSGRWNERNVLTLTVGAGWDINMKMEIKFNSALSRLNVHVLN